MSDYPDPKTLQLIATWDGEDPRDMLELIDKAWNHVYGEVHIKYTTTGVIRMELITGGWSGNEEVLFALHINRLWDALYWQKSERGGFHVYEVKE